MSNQGFFGALEQYWTVNEAPRLDRRNTFFDDVKVDNVTALRFGLVTSIVATAIIIFWSLLGVIL